MPSIVSRSSEVVEVIRNLWSDKMRYAQLGFAGSSMFNRDVQNPGVVQPPSIALNQPEL